MSSADTIDTLNRVIEILERSFTQYLRWARPYIPPARANIMQTIETICTGQFSLAERIAEQISESGGLPDHGDFPIEYADTHDLDIDYLIDEALDCLKQDITELEACVDILRLSPAAQTLASEALGLMKGNLEQLEKLDTIPADSTRLTATPAYANDVPISNEQTGTPHRQEPRKTLSGDPHSPG